MNSNDEFNFFFLNDEDKCIDFEEINSFENEFENIDLLLSDNINKNYNEDCEKVKIQNNPKNQSTKDNSNNKEEIEEKANLNNSFQTKIYEGEKEEKNLSINNNVIKENGNMIDSNLLKINKKEKKLGRKKKIQNIDEEEDNKNNIHTKFSTDNQIRKIKIHFFKFSVKLINDCIKKEFNRQIHALRNISKKITSDITIKKNNIFFNMKIGDILNMEINNKYKTIDLDENKTQINKIRMKNDKTPLTNELLDMNFKKMYEFFIDDEKKSYLKKRYGLIKAKNLNDFLNDLKEKGADENYIQSLRKNAQNFFNFFNLENARISSKE